MKEQKNYPLYEVTPVNSIRELLEIAEKEAGDKPKAHRRRPPHRRRKPKASGNTES